MYNEIVPKNLQEELIQIGEDITKNTFRIGDIVIAVMGFVSINGLGYTKSNVWRAVGSFIGKAAATVRGYEALALFYPQSVRKEYEILSASHFRKAMEIDSATDYEWRAVLEYAVKKIEDYGRPATVDELTRVFIYECEPFEYEEEEPIEHSLYNPIQRFENTIESLKGIIDLLPVSEPIREDIRRALSHVELTFSESLYDKVSH